MAEQQDPVAWARSEIERLKGMSDWAARAPGIEFLKRQTGPDSEFVRHASRTNPTGGTGVGFVVRALEQWVSYLESGGVQAQGFEVRARAEAATDLMEQVQQLLDAYDIHPAAPIMLAGAAL